MKFTNKILILVLMIFLYSIPLLSQVNSKELLINENSLLLNQDSLLTTQSDNSTTISESSTTATFQYKSSTGIDSVVVYSAMDTVKFLIRQKTMFLRGKSTLDYKEQHIKSEIIQIDFDKSLLVADGVRDSNNKAIGYPEFTDKGETFVGERIIYNFKTKQGTISLGETELSEGYYFGEKMKMISKTEIFVQDGKYTTCDNPKPHYQFGSPKMKVMAKDKILLDPIIFYVQDMPIFILPLGLFFPNKGGRQSGLIIPSFFFSKNRGVVLQDLGYYFALSDYYDTQFNVDFFSKGGYTMKNSTRWNLTDVFSGNMRLEYGKTKLNPDDDEVENYKFVLKHNQTLTPQSRFVADMSFMSKDNNRNTDFQSLNNRLTQNITSNASYSQSFDNGSSVSIAFNRDQNIITDEVRQTFPRLNYTLPQLMPLKSIIPTGTIVPDWLRDLSISYSGSGNYYTENMLEQGSETNFIEKYRSSINHNPGISLSPKLGYFNINPYFNFKANNYFRRKTKIYNPTDSTVSEEFEKGFFTEYNYSYGVNVSTKLFGIIKPELFDINAVRHTFQPTISYSFSPDLSAANNGFYDYYYDEVQDREIQYSRYEADGGGIASRSEAQSIRYSLLNNFEAKIAQGDTLDDKNIQFFRWTINGAYNMMADSLKFSDINMSFKIPATNNINMNASANFTPYDEAKRWDETQQDYTGALTRINQLLYKNDKGPLRLTRFSIQFSTSISSENKSTNVSDDGNQGDADNLGLGSRLKQRMEYTEGLFDYYGDNSHGYSDISIPWNISLGLNFQYNEPYQLQITRRINLTTNFSFKLTPTWNIRGSAQYDFVNKELLAPDIQISKDMHCWELSLQWWPVGYNAGFYLRFAVKAPQLSDLKIEKRSSPILR